MFQVEIRSSLTGKSGADGNQYAEKRAPEQVIVAVRAEKDISKTALAWALSHVVRPGDCITLLAILSSEKSKGRKLWSFPIFTGDCGSRHRERSPDWRCQISESCSKMVLQFHDQNQVGVKIKVVSGSSGGVVAAESKKAGANWVILDKQLKQEEKHCMEELHCNVVVMKRSQPKVLRLKLESSNEVQPPFPSYPTPESDDEKSLDNRLKHSTPVSSPEDQKTSFTRTSTTTTTGATSVSSSYTATSPFLVCEQNPLFEGVNKRKLRPLRERVYSDDPFTVFESDGQDPVTLSTNSSASSLARNQKTVYWIPENHAVDRESSIIRNYKNTHNTTKSQPSRTLLEKFAQFDRETRFKQLELSQSYERDYIVNSDLRDAVSLGRTTSTPPPLCSICQHKGPIFGRPPVWFDYRELEEATDGFSDMNFLSEGRFSSVHRGVLRDGQMVAVKQLKVSGLQGDADFCREVEVLSCAQHRNVVMLIGFCVEKGRRILVYEYVCNGSLDFHLHENESTSLDWHSRLKIAIGAARGLRYLHEDCRVGCIVHRDMRPSNILLTHDFEPLVGDFGLARWQPSWDIGTDTCVIGTLGYLAPEYTDGAKITEKADVYAFGMVLLELITGRRTIDLARHNAHKLLPELSLSMLALEQSHALTINHQFLDPRLDHDQLHNYTHQLQAMAQAASLCLCRDPESRPPMSKILRILEGDAIIPLGSELDMVGSRSARMHGPISHPLTESWRGHSRTLSH
ncbi:PREDICTED: inactive protein kinase SELMODRAFT_444075-like isoform X2 [Nelumbo nucifera]|uniref:non-specific serine/threonine protein kinase n=1 Tax=Nelumbo nucifera TaxID=4432 RepID=A0A1U8A0F1_NELNU|nr:PREDICTED: inactive protein kinase SELMODRAFT_444075-like isoform X2 [Nelumbo nucifera]